MEIITYESQFPDMRLRSINSTDIELLREWKNRHRFSFFYQNIITPEQQMRWYEKFCASKNDFMFMVEQLFKNTFVPIGCMGYREENGAIDVYNIMRGIYLEEASFAFKDAFLLMNAYIVHTGYNDITCRVLKSNPALNWYLKNGFRQIQDCNDHYLLKLDIKILSCIKINLLEEK